MTVSALPPLLVVGLGNPGREYAETRHNVGFWWVDRLCDRLGSRWSAEPRFFGHVARAGALWLLKPTTYMNASGRAIASVARYYRIPTEAILIVHDELDLPPGVARLKLGGGTAGHNGLKDARAHLGTDRFWRLRLGIGHPRDRTAVVSYVLSSPSPLERLQIDAAIERALALWSLIAEGHYARAQQQLHTIFSTPEQIP